MGENIFTDAEFDQLIATADEKEVLKAVVKEIGKYGDNTTAAYEELRKTVKGMQDKIDRDGTKEDEQLKKFMEDISVRQLAADKKAQEFVDATQKRMDEVEAFLQKHKTNVKADDPETEKLLKQFYVETRIATGKETRFSAMKDIEFQVEPYKEYVKDFETYLRTEDTLFKTMSKENKTLSIGIDPHGGYTVIPTVSNRIMQRLFETDPIRQLASTETISNSDAWEELTSWGDFDCGWVGENEARSQTDNGDLKKVKIPVHEMYAKPFATQLLLEDSGINIENWIAERVADKFSRTEGAAFVAGNGMNKPRGFLTYANGTGYGQVEQVAMGAAAAVTADGYINVKFAMLEALVEMGTWLMNRTTLRDSLKLKTGTGEYIWSPGLAADQYSTLLNRPVRLSTTMPAIAANALSVVYADFRRAYKIIDRLGMTVLRDPYSNKPFVEFYTRKRVGAGIVDFQAIKIGIISV